MPRRREVPVRKVIPDPKYNSELVARFIRKIMRDGKKSVAEGILYDAMNIIEQKAKKPPLEIFERAVDNIKPVIEVKSRRVGGSTYQVPTEIRPSRRTALGIRWIIEFSRKRPEQGMAAKLAGEQSPRGWGLFLIRNMVDEMHVHQAENRHTIELIMRRP